MALELANHKLNLDAGVLSPQEIERWLNHAAQSREMAKKKAKKAAGGRA